MTSKLHLSLCALAFVLCPALVFGQQSEIETERFQQQISIPAQEILVPTVIEVDLSGLQAQRNQFVVVDAEAGNAVGSLYQADYEVEPVQYIVSVDSMQVSVLTDGEESTSETFPVSSGESLETVTLDIQGNESFSASAFFIDLAPNVAMPTSVSVQTLDSGEPEIIVAKRPLRGTHVRFPKTTASQWQIVLEYGQPLRISELRFVQDDAESSVVNTLRFLAQPETAYLLYADPEVAVSLPRLESGDLSEDEGVLEASGVGLQRANPSFAFADSDDDTIPDRIDNCVAESNVDQADINNNGRGDVCDDFDRDGILNNIDNCVNQPNRTQLDEDGDGIGDVCDEEESRTTEKYGWIPWVAMGTAMLVFAIMFYVVLRRVKQDQSTGIYSESIKPPMSDTDLN